MALGQCVRVEIDWCLQKLRGTDKYKREHSFTALKACYTHFTKYIYKRYLLLSSLKRLLTTLNAVEERREVLGVGVGGGLGLLIERVLLVAGAGREADGEALLLVRLNRLK